VEFRRFIVIVFRGRCMNTPARALFGAFFKEVWTLRHGSDRAAFPDPSAAFAAVA
jgi:hypothetical protein